MDNIWRIIKGKYGIKRQVLDTLQQEPNDKAMVVAYEILGSKVEVLLIVIHSRWSDWLWEVFLDLHLYWSKHVEFQ